MHSSESNCHGRRGCVKSRCSDPPLRLAPPSRTLQEGLVEANLRNIFPVSVLKFRRVPYRESFLLMCLPNFRSEFSPPRIAGVTEWSV